MVNKMKGDVNEYEMFCRRLYVKEKNKLDFIENLTCLEYKC